MSTSDSESQMRRFQVMQHYRTRQRQYLQWRASQEEQREKPCYFPPHLRMLRNAWFVKRYERYKKQASSIKTEGTISGDTEPTPTYYSQGDIVHELDELEIVGQRIWWWLDLNEEEDRGRPLQRDGCLKSREQYQKQHRAITTKRRLSPDGNMVLEVEGARGQKDQPSFTKYYCICQDDFCLHNSTLIPSCVDQKDDCPGYLNCLLQGDCVESGMIHSLKH